MSDLSSLIAYYDDNEDAPPAPARAAPEPPSPSAAVIPSQGAITVPAIASSSSSSSASSSKSPSPPSAVSSPAPSPSSQRLVSVLAPVFAKLPALSSPPPPSHVSAFLSAFPAHIAPLLSKKEALSSSSASSSSAPPAPSLLSQLTSLPSYHNPYILERIIARLHVDEQASLLPDSRSAAADSLQSITEQAEEEQRRRRDREEEEQKQRLSQLEAKRSAATASVEQQRTAALPAVLTLADERDAKRAEAMRRVAAINARLQQQQQRPYQ